MKQALIAWLLLSGISLTAQTNADYCLLKIYRGVGSNKDSVKVKVYNQEQFNVPPKTLIIFKIYSKGGFVVSANNGEKLFVPDPVANRSSDRTDNNFSHPTFFLQFAPGKVICMLASPGGGKEMLKEIDESDFNKKIEKADHIIELEEDMTKPIKKNEKYSK